MVQFLAAFMDLCYIFHRNAILSSALAKAEELLTKFHQLHNIFINLGICDTILLPCQHSFMHYITSIPLFGLPNVCVHQSQSQSSKGTLAQVKLLSCTTPDVTNNCLHGEDGSAPGAVTETRAA